MAAYVILFFASLALYFAAQLMMERTDERRRERFLERWDDE